MSRFERHAAHPKNNISSEPDGASKLIDAAHPSAIPGATTTASTAAEANSRSDARPASPPPAISANNIPASDLAPGAPRSLAGIALRAFLLGASLCFGTLSTLYLLQAPSTSTSSLPDDADAPDSAPSPTPTPLWRLPFFLSALSLFHFLEFYTTAAYNTPAADISSFLLTANWPAYAIAHAFATLECLLACLLFPSPYAPLSLHAPLLASGVVLVLVGQTVRSLAMVTAGRSFNHTVQHRRAASHALVTSGIYGYFRHPSYFGFFWWAIGTQLVMGNVVSFVGYAVVLWKFFSGRIEHEEELLVSFFGTDYEDYKARVWTWIPFCG